jgi:hypothetical protein
MDSITFSMSVTVQSRLKASNSPLEPTQHSHFANSLLGYSTYGDGSGEADVCWLKTVEIAASGNATIALDGPSTNPVDGATGDTLVTLTGVHIRMIANADASTMSSSISVVGTDDEQSPFIWTAEGSGNGAIIPRGGFLAWGSDTGIDLTAEAGGVRFLNNDATNKATVEITIIGRSA